MIFSPKINAQYKEKDSLVFHWNITYDSLGYEGLKPINLQFDSIDVRFIQPYQWLDNPHHKLLPYKVTNHASQQWNSQSDAYALNQIGFYYARSPYVSAYYSFGSKQNQTLRLFHTQNIGKNFNYAIRFDRDQSLGYLRNDAVNNNNVSLSLHGEFNKYHIRFQSVFYTKSSDEGGGLADTSLLSSRSQELVPVNITAGEYKTKGVGGNLEQRLYAKDTTGRGLYFFMQNKLYSNAVSYVETGSSVTNFYDVVYFDSTETLFSQKFNTTSNGIGLGQSFQKFNWAAQTYMSYDEYRQQTLRVNQRNLWAKGNLDWRFGKFVVDAEGRFSYFGDQLGNFAVDGNLRFVDSIYKGSIKAHFSSLDPYLEHRYMLSNNFQWNSELTTQQKLWLEMNNDLWNEKLTVKLGWVAVKDAVYFIEDANQVMQPKIYNQSASLLYAEVGTHLQFWKMHWVARVRGNLTKQNEIFNYPVLEASTRLYFDGAVFKSKKLVIQTGFEANYTSPVQSFGYMPFLQSYYLRPNSGKVGNMLFLDFFLNMHISSVDVFVKVYHWNAGWMFGRDVYLADNYPVSPFHFRVGLRWQFLN